MNARPLVAVIGCGGTISSLASHRLDTIDYPDDGRKLDVDGVLAAVPETAEVAQVLPVAHRAVSSTAMTTADLLALRRKIADLTAQNANLAGVVILHGTAALEETAFFLHLTVATTRPVVLVGAQRPLNAVGSDGPSNLIAALRVAGAPDAAGRGVLVVLNDEIHSARDVQKSSNYRLQTFRSPDYGMLGQVDGDRIVFKRALTTPHTSTSPFAGIAADAGEFPRVDVLYSHLGSDAILVDASIAAGAAGLVSVAFPPGLVTAEMAAGFERAAHSGHPVVVCSRAASGRVGARRHLLRTGLIPGEDFSPQKARILLQLVLKAGFDVEGVRNAFATF